MIKNNWKSLKQLKIKKKKKSSHNLKSLDLSMNLTSQSNNNNLIKQIIENMNMKKKTKKMKAVFPKLALNLVVVFKAIPDSKIVYLKYIIYLLNHRIV